MSSRRANPLLIGGFVTAGLLILAAATIVLSGGRWFSQPQRVVMFFSGSVYGLQKGAPVVFRGVKVGTVQSVEVYYETDTDSFAIPVVAELDADAVRGLDGLRADRDIALAVPGLVERGLTAQLGTQSLLTGQLYVDLDLRPRQRGVTRGTFRGDAIEVPTAATAIQNLKNQFDGMDFRRIVEDVGQIAAATRELVGSDQTRQALADLAATTAALKRVAARLEQRSGPLMDGAQRALASVDGAGKTVTQAADSVKGAAGHASALLAPDSPSVQALQATLAEAAAAAEALRRTADADGPLARSGERALHDLAAAARALRQLSLTLDEQPQSLLRGRRDPPVPPLPQEGPKP
jgi:paraquat-inducible protein B